MESKDVDPGLLSPLNLAFIGDTVFDLYVRKRLVLAANRPVKKLHQQAASLVNAAAQAKAAKEILPFLTETEVNIFKRGRNAHTNHKAKNMSESDYHCATGLEALFGYLYLQGEKIRLDEIFEMICKAISD